MKPEGRSGWKMPAFCIALAAVIGYAIGTRAAPAERLPLASITGSNNTLILIGGNCLKDQPSRVPSAASLIDCATAEPTRRKAFCPASSAAR